MSSTLSGRRSVCALVPHLDCERWLPAALESLTAQSRPLDAIVVIDDGSDAPPVGIVERFDGVTLVATPDTGGPYRAVQAVIDATDFDAYLFQDADDWSARDRLEALLAEADRTGAELVGSHEVRVVVDEADVALIRYPLDVNAALAERATAFPLLHPTSLAGRDMLNRIGGFATGMRFSGDVEMLRRAAHTARVVNADHFGYFRRKRAGSLTTAPGTALRSSERMRVQGILAERATRNAEAVASGEEPDLRPYATVAPAALTHLAGPRLGARLPRRARRRPRRRPECETGPVLILGAPRSGQRLLAWALGEHPSFVAVPDAGWIAGAAAAIESCAGDEGAPPPAAFRDAMTAALAALLPEGRWVAGAPELVHAAYPLSRLFPGARLLHVVRAPGEVVSSLAARPTESGVYYTPGSALRAWTDAARAGLDTEAALGPDTVLRLRHDDLLERPGDALRRVLDFLGEPFAAECLRPVEGVAADTETGCGSELLDEDAVELAKLLLGGTQPPGPDDRARARLADAARRRGRSGPDVATMAGRVRDVIARATPEGSTVAVVSRGDPALVDLPGRDGWHFPQADAGVWAGHYPKDGADALAHLEQLRSRGAGYLAIPAAGFWWLTYYDGLRAHLEGRGRLVAFEEDACAVYALSGVRGFAR